MSTPAQSSKTTPSPSADEGTAGGQQFDAEEELPKAEEELPKAEEELRRLEAQEEEALMRVDEEIANIRAQQEIARVRARHALRSLEADRPSRGRADRLDESSSRTRQRSRLSVSDPQGPDLPGRTVDATTDVVRASSAAYAEGLRSIADVVDSFADSFSDRTCSVRARSRFEPEVAPRRRGGSSGRRLVTDLPSQTYESLLDAVDEYLQVPSRTIDRFYESYRGSSRP